MDRNAAKISPSQSPDPTAVDTPTPRADVAPMGGPSLMCAFVAEVADGFPRSVTLGGRTVAVSGVIQAVPGLAGRFRTDDAVAVAESDHGLMVYGAVQFPDTPASSQMAVGDEHLVVDARGITLKGEQATVELLHDGKIRISARRILTVSKGPTTIKGSVIELN